MWISQSVYDTVVLKPATGVQDSVDYDPFDYVSARWQE